MPRLRSIAGKVIIRKSQKEADAMIQALPQQITFDEFIAWYPEQREHRYELHNGIITEMPKPKGKHSEIAGFLNGEYQMTQFRGEELIQSPTFPDFNLTAQQVFQVGE